MQTIHKIVLANSQKMTEVDNSSIQLMVTSPPYPMIKMWDPQFSIMNSKVAVLWNKLKNTGEEEIVKRIYDEMHNALSQTWQETFRVLIEGGIACINIGDATRTLNSTFRLFPNHSRIIEQCEKIGFTTLPYILWKKPTKKPRYKGKAVFLGSGFLPPNAYVTLDCEFILLFRKGKPRKFPPNDPRRYESAFTKEQRNKWFTQIWKIAGTRQKESRLDRRTAAYPDEIADRLIKMFSIKGDTVLDPFLGSGTTVKLAIQNERNSIGYEADKTLLPLIKEKIATKNPQSTLEYIRRAN